MERKREELQQEIQPKRTKKKKMRRKGEKQKYKRKPGPHKSRVAKAVRRRIKEAELKKKRLQIAEELPYTPAELVEMKRTTLIMICGVLGHKDPLVIGHKDACIREVLRLQKEKFG